MRKLTSILSCAMSLSMLTRIASADALPTDNKFISGKLDNGLDYIIRQHSNPKDRAVIWLHMHTGSLNETDPQRGIAHYLEHMAFNGSENFAPGSLIPYFQSLGMQFGRDQNAFTSFDQTTFQLSLPNVKPETIEKGMTFFADVTGRLLLQPKEIDSERGIIQEERRRSLSGRQRTGYYVLEHIAPGSIFGQRIPIGTEETINGVKENDFRDYYGKWYSASNATLMVVADTDPKLLEKAIKDAFGSLPAKPKPAWQEIGIKPYEKNFAIVASDAEIRTEELRISTIQPPKPATKTTEQMRDDLVSEIGQSAFNRRMSDKVARGGTPYSGMSASAENEPTMMYTTDIQGRSKPGQWRETLAAMAMELQRAREFGFSQREIDDVKKDIISSAEWAAQTEDTATADALISRANAAVSSGEPIMSPAQNLEMLNKVVPTINAEEVDRKFSADFEPKTVAFVAILPATGSIPSDADLLSEGNKALTVKPEREAEVAHAEKLLDEMPAAGTVAQSEEHAASKVYTGTLSNNVLLHHRYMDDEKNEVTIQIALLGGELLETAENRGVTSAAGLAWSRPATAKLTSTDVRELMTGKKVTVRGGGGGGRRGGGLGGVGDSINLTISGSPEELEAGFQLAYLLLTQPRIEAAAFEQFQTSTKQALEEAKANPMMAGMRAVGSAPYPKEEPRTQPLTAEQVDKLTLEKTQAWLDQLIKESPIEVTIVGDLQKDKALDLVTRYLGALPTRPKVSHELFGDVRKLNHPTAAVMVNETINTPTKQAFVMSGFYGPDETAREDVRAVNMATRILSTRMIKEVREDQQLVYSIGAALRPGTAFPGFGLVLAAAPTDPSKTDALVAKLAEMYQTFADKGPTEEEVVVARKQFANTYDEQLKEPSFWMTRLGEITYRGLTLDQLMKDPEAYQSMTADQVKQAFAKYYDKDKAVVVVVKPAAATN